MYIKSFFILLTTGILITFSGRAQIDSTRAAEASGELYADSVAAEIPTEIIQEEKAPALEWGGFVMTDDRMRIDGYKLHWQEYRLDFQAQYKLGSKTRFYSELWVRGIRTPDITKSSDLMFSNRIMPVELDLREAYVDLYGLFTKNLDVRIGRQRIAWGTGDKLNPTDNLNPYDMEDVWDFGRHSASNALQLKYYAGNWTFTGVGILNFSPSTLPGSDWTAAFMPEASLPAVAYDNTTIPGITLPIYITTTGITDTLILPRRDIRHSPSFGFKVKRSIGAWDLSVSYVYTHDAIPMLSKAESNITIDTVVLNLPSTLYAMASGTVKATLEYPVQKIIGFDFAGSLWGIGLRGEAACFIPEKRYMQQRMHIEAPDYGISRDSAMADSLISDGKAYVKFLLGLDYTFKNNIYLNFQYLHGFIHERGSSELNDYFVLGLDWTLCKSKLKLSLLNSGLQVSDWKDFKNAYAFMYLPELSYTPVDNATFTLGAHFIDGSSGAGFGKVHKNDDIFLRFKYSF